MYRFFVPPAVVQSESVVLGPELAHRLGRVLRMRSGDHLVLLDNTGWEYEAEVASITRERVEVRLLGKSLAPGEPVTCIHLYQGLLKAAKFEWVLQKGTELGVSSFTPLVCRRSVTEPPSSAVLARWRRIVQEAAEQSRRGLLPALNSPLDLADAIASAPGLRLLPWEGERTRGLRSVLQAAQPPPGRSGTPQPEASTVGAGLSDRPWAGPHPRPLPKGEGESSSPRPVARSPLSEVSLLIGPEGGWEGDEVTAAVAQGAVAVSLGPRILRAETAGLVAATAILYHTGELGDR